VFPLITAAATELEGGLNEVLADDRIGMGDTPLERPAGGVVAPLEDSIGRRNDAFVRRRLQSSSDASSWRNDGTSPKGLSRQCKCQSGSSSTDVLRSSSGIARNSSSSTQATKMTVRATNQIALEPVSDLHLKRLDIPIAALQRL
jgi:hypothetical protein